MSSKSVSRKPSIAGAIESLRTGLTEWSQLLPRQLEVIAFLKDLFALSESAVRNPAMFAVPGIEVSAVLAGIVKEFMRLRKDIEGVREPMVQLNDILVVSRSTAALPLLHLACASMAVGWLKVFLRRWCS